MPSGLEKIKEELGPRLKFLRENGMLLEAQRLQQRTMFDLELLKKEQKL